MTAHRSERERQSVPLWTTLFSCFADVMEKLATATRDFCSVCVHACIHVSGQIHGVFCSVYSFKNSYCNPHTFNIYIVTDYKKNSFFTVYYLFIIIYLSTNVACGCINHKINLSKEL